jgi:hypothetical protein
MVFAKRAIPVATNAPQLRTIPQEQVRLLYEAIQPLQNPGKDQHGDDDE